MQDASEWLAGNIHVKIRAAKDLGYTKDELLSVILNDISQTRKFAESLYENARKANAPMEIQEQLLDFKRIVENGVDRLEKSDKFAQKTLSAFEGLREPNDFKMVIRGALAHAPTEDDSRTLNMMNETIDRTRERIESGGSLAWCLAGCVICGEGCLICCTIMLAD